jgi:methyl-accepting chemotaxis protein
MLLDGKLSFSNLRIAVRLALGTGVILVLLTVVAGAAYFGLNGAVADFAEYRKLARQTASMALIQADVLGTRMYMKDFLLKGSEESMAQVGESADAAAAGSEQALELFTSEETRAEIGAVGSMLREYETAFGQVKELRAQRNQLVDQLDGLGPKIEQNLSEVMRSANGDADASAAFGAGETLRNLLLARLYVTKFLSENDPAHVERVRQELAAAGKQGAALLAQLQNPARRKLAGEVVEWLDEYATGVEALQGTIFERNGIIGGTLDRIGPDVAGKLSAMTDANKASQDEIGPRATAAMERTLWTAVIIAGISIALGILISLLLARSITRPITGMTSAMETLAGGNKTIDVPALDRKDEVGLMAKAVQVFKENMIKADELAEKEARSQREREERARAIEGYIKTFETSAAESLAQVASAATEMRSTSEGMSTTAEETSRQATAVAAASEQASTNVQTVASAAEELSSSIVEISRQVAQSAEIARKAVTDAERTNTQVKGLADAAQKIGDVVSLINDIASQTNLLALNATIEAARAGEAGKGFAVVASEVKNLANETAKATDEITTQISGVQAATREAVAAIQAIGQTIGQINEIATTIASAVEEQGAATQEIARNVQQAAAGTTEVSTNISGVTQAAGETGAAASQVLSASGELARQGETLRGEVEKFLAAVRAA